MSRYRKTIAALGGFLGVAGAALADGDVSGSEGASLLLAAAGVIAVYAFPNKPELELSRNAGGRNAGGRNAGGRNAGG